MKYKEFKDKFKEIQIALNVNSKAIQSLTQQTSTLDTAMNRNHSILGNEKSSELETISLEIVDSISSLKNANEKLCNFYCKLINDLVEED